MAAAARGSAYRRVEHRRLRSKQSATATAATRAESCRLLLLGDWTAAGRRDCSVVLCAKIGKCTCTKDANLDVNIRNVFILI